MGTPTMIENEQALLEVVKAARELRRWLSILEFDTSNGLRIPIDRLDDVLANLDRLNP